MRTRGGADLHVHTTASDGTWTPEEMVRRAARIGLDAVAVTDHDTVAGVEPALRAARLVGIEVLPGVELNATEGDREIHIIGYLVDLLDPDLVRLLEELRIARCRRLEKMVRRLRAAGVDVTLSRVRELAGRGSPGRPHVARAVVESGHAASISDAFARYLGPGAPGYVERYRVTPRQAINLIKNAGGVAVLAHPGLIGDENIVFRLARAGLDGIEAYYPEHSPAQRRRLVELAGHLGMVVTGGSDAHGPGSESSAGLGEVTVPYEAVETLKRRAESARRR